MKTEAMCRFEFITNFNFACKVNYVVFILASSLSWQGRLSICFMTAAV